MSDLPPDKVFDGSLAKKLIGKSLLIGITRETHDGEPLSRSQVFGIVITVDRSRGICIRDSRTGDERWLPPDTRGIRPAPRGEYRNRATGEMVTDPDYLASWTITAPPTTKGS